MRLATQPPTPAEAPDSKFLLYLVSAVSGQLGTMLASHPSLGQNGNFIELYHKVLGFYEGFEDGDIAGIAVGQYPDNDANAMFGDGYRQVDAKLGKKNTVTLQQVEDLYDSTVIELRKIIDSRRGVVDIHETALELPAVFSQSFEQFRSGIDRSTAHDYFKEAYDAAADSIILGELPEGISAVIASVRGEVWDRVWERLSRGMNPTYDLLRDSSSEEPQDGVSVIDDNGKDQAELIRLMALTDQQLAQTSSLLGTEVIEAITHYRQLVRDDMAFGNGPADQEIRAEWTARIKSKPKPKLTLVGDGDERKDPKRAPSPSDSGTSSGSTGGDAAQTSVRDVA